MKRAKKPNPKPRPPAEQMEIEPGFDLRSFPIFSGSNPIVKDSPFKPAPAARRPAVDLFGNTTRPTLEELQRRASQ